MKSLYLRSSLALACALGLSACGGGDDNLLLGGTIIGLTKDGLELQNKGGPALKIPANADSFTFPELISSDSEFDVTIKTQPTASNCEVKFGKGKAGAFSVMSVEVWCTTFRYDVGGTITGLDSAGLVLINGSERQTIPAGATSFTMTKYKANGEYDTGRVPDGAPYGITVLQQPAGRTCTVANGTGTMGNTAVTNVAVTCS